MRILFATGNPHKVAEAVQMLSPLGHGVEPLLVDASDVRVQGVVVGVIRKY